MATPPIPDPFLDFCITVHEGMNDKLRPWLLNENSAAYLENLNPSKPGERKRRTGVASIGGHAAGPYGLWRAKDTTLGQEALFAIYNGEVFIAPGGGVIDERASDASLVNALHFGIEGRYNNRLCTFIVQAHVHDSDSSLASNLLVITDDNTWTQVTDVRPTVGQWFQNRLWIANNVLDQDEETLWYSGLGDGLSYSAYNTLQIYPGIGGHITALLPLRGETPALLIFKERAIAAIFPHWGSSSSLIPIPADQLDTIETAVPLISKTVGCVAQLSIQEVEGAPGGPVYFWSKEGLRALTRAQDDRLSGVTLPLSDGIKTTVARINYNYAHKMVSTIFDDKYHIAVPLDGATENTHIITFDLINQGWYLNTWAPKAIVTARTIYEQEQFWMQYSVCSLDCSNTAAASMCHIFKGFSGLLDPNGIPVIYREDSRSFAFKDISKKKIWDYAWITMSNEAAESCVLTLQYNVDQTGWITMASAIAHGMYADDPILGVDPLPWGYTTGYIKTYKYALNDVPPGYEIQLRYAGVSDLSVPVIYNLGVAARQVYREFDNEIG